jgi:predicted metalloprotease with PDZ domain
MSPVSSPRAARRLIPIAIFIYGVATAVPPAGPRPLELAVDATDAPRGIFHSRMVIPAVPGPLTLAYPQWVQGEHAPTGPIMQVAGFTVQAGGRALPWRRDPLDMFLVKVEVPAGAREVEVTLDYLSPSESFGLNGYGETPNATSHLLIVDWHDLLVYPLGANAAEIPVRATVRLPAGWQYDTALPLEKTAGGKAKDGALLFSPTTLYTLIDSPVLAGDLFRTIDLGPPEAPVFLSIAADRASALAVPAARLAAYRRVPAEALALFGARHYRAYHWLLALSDAIDDNGLEHHESSDDRGKVEFFTDEAQLLRWGTLLPHEYVHSWNGKYRRPAGLATRDPNQALATELLWVYEGLTRYLGDFLLTTRSGIRTVGEAREYAAYVAANQDRNRPGRRWRPLADTAISVQSLSGAPTSWTAYRRALDYYDESMLIWLEADTTLREKSGGAKSLDDFCRAFYGPPGTAPTVVPYTADDVYAALGRIVPYDWRGFFAERVYAVQPRAPLRGFEAAGWKLVYTEKPNDYQKQRAKSSKLIDESFSLGIWLKDDGTIADIVVGSPAWEAGLGSGMKLLAVDGRTWTSEVLPEKIQAAKTAAMAKTPIEITAAAGEAVKTFRVDYHEGEKYPHLERMEGRGDLLEAILAPKGKY